VSLSGSTRSLLLCISPAEIQIRKPWGKMKSWVERVVVKNDLGSHIDRWKQMRHEVWESEVVLSHDHKTVVCMGFRDEQLMLF